MTSPPTEPAPEPDPDGYWLWCELHEDYDVWSPTTDGE